MSYVTTNQPDGTPTWIDLGIPDLDRAKAFYGAVFGWEFDVGRTGAGRYTMCLLNGRPVAAIMPTHARRHRLLVERLPRHATTATPPRSGSPTPAAP